MPDILIRNVPDDVIAVLEANAKRAGLSRAEYLRRMLGREHRIAGNDVTVDSLRGFAEVFSDLDNAAVMSPAWS